MSNKILTILTSVHKKQTKFKDPWLRFADSEIYKGRNTVWNFLYLKGICLLQAGNEAYRNMRWFLKIRTTKFQLAKL